MIRLPCVVPASLVGLRRLRTSSRWRPLPTLRGMVIGDQLYVAADLRAEVIDGSYAYTCARDLLIEGVPHRRLELPWYAWLYRQMIVQQRRHDAGEIASDHWETLRHRFARVYAWARSRFREIDLGTAHQVGPSPNYLPPPSRAA